MAPIVSRNGGVIAAEGWWPVLGLLLLSALATLVALPWLALLGVLLSCGVLFLFRDPPRKVPSLPLAVVAPVDGVIRDIQQSSDNSGQDTPVIVIEIDILTFGAWSIRAPVEGKLMGLRGLKQGPERGLWLRTDENDDVVTELLGRSRPYWARPVAFVKTGERLGQGQRFGYRRLASQARVHIYGGANLNVSTGQRVYAGTDLLATLFHR